MPPPSGGASLCIPSKERRLWPPRGPRRCPVLGLTSVTSHLQEKRIYDLKKKNQELEKFKFVLDYKIKELKKQIEPREKEIKVMKEQIQEVRGQLPQPPPSQLPAPGGPGVMSPPQSPSVPKACAATTPQPGV